MDNNAVLQTDNGLIRFYDGTIISIEIREYSHNGLTHWEETFNPDPHISTIDGVTEVGGHLYTRIKHTGDTNYQLPYRIIPKEPVFRIEDGILEWKFLEEDNTEWKELLDTETLRGEDGEKGDQGIQGDGIHLDEVGYIKTRRDCCGTLQSSNCNSCNRSDDVGQAPYLFLSIGDGLMILTATIIATGSVEVDGVTYTHFSNDLSTWVDITDAPEDFEVRYLATDDTGAVYTDMRTEDYYSSRGKVYICADGRWVEFVNLNVPLYMVQEQAGSTNIGYLDHFVKMPPMGVGYDIFEESITIRNGKLVIRHHQFDQQAFITGTFGDGLDFDDLTGDPVKAKVEDFDGYGLSSYTSNTDGEEDLQTNLTNLVSFGIDTTNLDKAGDLVNSADVDGATPVLVNVDVVELIDTTSVSEFTGLEYSTPRGVTETDGWERLFVKQGDCILTNVDGVNVIADEETIEADGLTALRVKEEGIQGIHIHTGGDVPVFNTQYGFNVDNIDTSGAEVDIQIDTFDFNGNGEIYIIEDAIHGTQLNIDAVANEFGLVIDNANSSGTDRIRMKVDDAYFDFNGLGELTLDSSILDNFVTDIVPKLNDAVLPQVDNSVTFSVTDDTGIDANMTSNAITDEITLSFEINTAWLDDYIDAATSDASRTVYWGALEYDETKTTTIEQYIDSLKHVELNKWYNNMMVSDGSGSVTTDGLILVSPDGGDGQRTYRVIVDDEGNLDTIEV